MESGTIVSTNNFTIEGFGSTQLEIQHTLPAKYANDGEIRLKIIIDRNSVIPALGSQDILTDDSASIVVNVKGTLKENEASKSSGNTAANPIVIAAAGGVALVGAGIGYFVYSRTKSGATEAMEDPFGRGAAEQPPAMAPPVPEQPPAAAPPAPGETILSVAVPAGAQPGQQIQIKAPDGRVVAVTIPAGLQPGQQFQIKV